MVVGYKSWLGRLELCGREQGLWLLVALRLARLSNVRGVALAPARPGIGWPEHGWPGLPHKCQFLPSLVKVGGAQRGASLHSYEAPPRRRGRGSGGRAGGRVGLLDGVAPTPVARCQVLLGCVCAVETRWRKCIALG
jgi:hypothetical protein